MNFVSCVKWVKQGSGKSVPDKVFLNEDELKQLLEEENSDNEGKHTNNSEDDEYGFNKYDQEDDSVKVKVKDVVVFDNLMKKKKRKKPDESDSDSEKEDEEIKPDDNLILVGHVDDELNSLEIYVYNDNEGDWYIHHDLMLPSIPLCVEWVDFSRYDTSSKSLAFIGSMDPVIEAWDLDIIGCVEPAFKLGRYKKKTSNKNYGHCNAVLDIAWNMELPHILASGSVDKSVLLWDLDTGSVSTTMSQFTNKVQSLQWNPFESHNLLVGCADKCIRNFDCRSYDEYQTWHVKSGVEKIVWNLDNSYLCYAGTESGYIYNIDTRMNKYLSKFRAHNKEVTGLTFSKSYPNSLISCSMDETLKLWDISDCRLLYSRDIKLDSLQCMHVNPDLPYLLCVGGTSLRKSKNIKVLNMNKELHKMENEEISRNTNVDPATSSSIQNNFNVALFENDCDNHTKPKQHKLKMKKGKSKTSYGLKKVGKLNRAHDVRKKKNFNIKTTSWK